MGDFNGIERRTGNMADINRELGEIKTLLEQLREEMKEFKQGWRRDYEYLDDKIDKKISESVGAVVPMAENARMIGQDALDRVKKLQQQHDDEEKLRAELMKNPWNRFKAKLFDVGSNAIAIGLIGFVAWLAIQYIGAKIPL